MRICRTIPRRSRSSHSESHPTPLHAMTRSEEPSNEAHTPMTRSVISYYQESGRRCTALGNNDVIYAPEGTFVGQFPDCETRRWKRFLQMDKRRPSEMMPCEVQ